MGKRKASRKIPTKKTNVPLASTFKCIFCHHDKSVTVKMDKGTMFGHLTCKTCGQTYTHPINNLSAAVDVYYDWVDACEELRAKQPKKIRAVRGPSPLKHGAQGGVNLNITNGEEVDEDVDADGEDDVGGYGKAPRRRDDEDVDDDVDDLDDGVEKRRRVELDDYDEDD